MWWGNFYFVKNVDEKLKHVNVAHCFAFAQRLRHLEAFYFEHVYAKVCTGRPELIVASSDKLFEYGKHVLERMLSLQVGLLFETLFT